MEKTDVPSGHIYPCIPAVATGSGRGREVESRCAGHSVISYLVARRNQRDLIVAANQELTVEWWERRGQDFELYVSAVVLAEVARGNEQFAAAARPLRNS